MISTWVWVLWRTFLPLVLLKAKKAGQTQGNDKEESRKRDGTSWMEDLE